jgi:pyrroline-5-carboxylate reductase
MTRIGILGINDLTETFLVELFRRDPYAHVFLSAEDNERANLLARKFPCWVQDNGQSVVDEADIVLISHRESGQKILSISKHSWFFY